MLFEIKFNCETYNFHVDNNCYCETEHQTTPCQGDICLMNAWWTLDECFML